MQAEQPPEQQQPAGLDGSSAAAAAAAAQRPVGPSVVYVDDPIHKTEDLIKLLPSLQHILADVLHVMKRVYETLAARHPKAGEHDAVNAS